MPSQEEIDRQQQLLDAHRATLAILLAQQARHTRAYTPPATEHGIREARAEIERAKRTLRGWGIAVEDQPDDEDSEQTPSAPAVQARKRAPAIINIIFVAVAAGLIVFLITHPDVITPRLIIPTPASPTTTNPLETPLPAATQAALSPTRPLLTFFIGSSNPAADNAAAANPTTINLLIEAKYITTSVSIGSVYEERVSGTTQLISCRRMRKSGNPEYLVATSGHEPKGCASVQIEGYVYESPRDGTIPLKQYYSPSRDEYALTTESMEKYPQYELRDVIGYILP